METPYHAELARSDRTIGWEKVAAMALGVALVAQGLVLYERWHRELPRVDVIEVAELPIERLRNVTPDVIDATGFAREAAERLLRISPATMADDQAWILNRCVPPLAEMYALEVPRMIGMAREVDGEVRAHVKGVTPLQGHLPFRMEVTVVQEFVGDFKAPGRGKADPDNPRREETRLLLTLVRTAKSHLNRDALLIREWSFARAR